MRCFWGHLVYFSVVTVNVLLISEVVRHVLHWCVSCLLGRIWLHKEGAVWIQSEARFALGSIWEEKSSKLALSCHWTEAAPWCLHRTPAFCHSAGTSIRLVSFFVFISSMWSCNICCSNVQLFHVLLACLHCLTFISMLGQKRCKTCVTTILSPSSSCK